MTDPIFFIHGFPFDSQMWRHQIAAFEGYERVVSDLWGAGLVNIPADTPGYSLAEHAGRAVQTLDNLRVDAVVVCCQSMGGYITFELLRQFPERVTAAILCNTKATADTAETKSARDAMAAKILREGTAPIAAELVPRLLSRITQAQHPELVSEVATIIERQPPHGMIANLRALRDRRDSTDVLERIRVPVLVIAGDDDQITPAEGMRAMAGAIPRAEFVLVAGAGHLAPLEQPDAVNNAIASFLERL